MKKIFYIIVFTCLLNTLLFSQYNCTQNNRYLDSVFQQVNITTGIKFGEANPYNPLVSNQELFLDIYEPVGDTVLARPLIVHAFGGGFISGNRTGDDIPYWGSEYAKKGFVFVSVDYRIGYNPLDGGSTERAAYRCMQDIRAALRYLADNTQTYKLDLDNFYLTGNSAGSIGGLISVFMDDNDRPASTYGTFFESSDLGCMDCSGNSNFNNQKVPVKAHINLWGAVYDTSYIDVAANPEDNVPVISFHGTADGSVPYESGNPYGLPIFPVVYGSYPIHLRMTNQGIRNELVPFPGFPHEPEGQYPWVSDTIVSKASKFIYPILYGDSARILGDNSLCSDSSKTYSAEIHSGSSYCWHVPTGQVIQNNGSSIEVVWNTPGLHSIILTETDKKGLVKYDTLWVEVGHPPVSNLNYTAHNGLVEFALDNPNLISASWQFGDGNSSTTLSPTHQYADTGAFTVQVIFADIFCSSDTFYTIISNKCPDATIAYTTNDSTITLYNISSLADSVLWVTPNGNLIAGDTLIYNTPANGSYPFILYSYNQYCHDTSMVNVPVLHCSKSDFSYTANGLSVRFYENSYNAFFYNWDFGNGNTSGEPNPTAQTYSSAGTYEVRLITYNIEGCSDTIYKQITLQAPNSISNLNNGVELTIFPNPANNQIQFVYSQNYNQAEVVISDVSGRILHQQNHLNTLYIGQSFASGTYFIQVRIDGNVFTEKIVIIQ
jgi:PKD repeat protein